MCFVDDGSERLEPKSLDAPQMVKMMRNNTLSIIDYPLALYSSQRFFIDWRQLYQIAREMSHKTADR